MLSLNMIADKYTPLPLSIRWHKRVSAVRADGSRATEQLKRPFLHWREITVATGFVPNGGNHRRSRPPSHSSPRMTRCQSPKCASISCT